jgi:hypothetical protein
LIGVLISGDNHTKLSNFKLSKAQFESEITYIKVERFDYVISTATPTSTYYVENINIDFDNHAHSLV